MAKLRVYELAKELSMESREVIRRLGIMGLELKNHMSTVDDKFADQLREMVKPGPNRTFIPPNQTGQVAKRTEKRGPGRTNSSKESGQHIPNEKREQSRTFQTGDRSYKQQGTKPNDYKPHRPQGQRADDKTPQRQSGPRPGEQRTPKHQGTPVGDNRQQRPSGPRTDDHKPPRYQGAKPGGQRSQLRGGETGQQRLQGAKTDNFQQRPQGPRSDERRQRPAGADLQTGKPVGSEQQPKKNTSAKKPFKPEPRQENAPDNANKNRGWKKPGQRSQMDFSKGKGGQKGRGNRKQQKKVPKNEIPAVVPKKVVIGESIIVSELAKSMGKTSGEIIKKLMEMGTMATINQEIDADTAILIAEEFNVPVEVRVDKTMEIMEDQAEKEQDMVERPPVVTVMGHVDHGKTSLLDAIRKANVIATEAGGITQHIGAYQVEINNKKITFLDTPGHEAFTAMRARGAQVTDIAILVVAADDGVMPQTVEAINHAKAAEVPIIVAINKIDKPSANPERVKQELTEHGVVAEEWGGDTIMVPVSAKTHEGIPQMLEMVLLVSEVGELKANPDRLARGTVVEAELDKGRGPVATVLVQKGTLHIGDNVVAGTTFGKVRAMIDDKGRRIKSALPSTPVEVLGFSEVPPAGEIFVAIEDEKDARYIAGKYQIKKREEEMGKTARVSLDDLFKQISEGEVKELNIIIKADVQGSIEALSQSLNKLSTNEVRVNIIHGGVGTITESDVMLASASNAIIIGFNVRPDTNTRKAIEAEKIDLRLYRVIYDAIEDVKAAMTGLLDPTFKEVVIGRAEVRTTFKVPKVGTIAGSYVTEGKITRNAGVRVIRDGIVIHEGKISSLKRFKDDVKEVVSGYECGIGVENFNDLKDNDAIEAFIMEETKREL